MPVYVTAELPPVVKDAVVFLGDSETGYDIVVRDVP